MKQRIWTSGLATVGLVLAGAFPALAQAPVQGGTAVYVLNQEPPSVNPDTSNGVPDKAVGCMIYQGLLQVTTDFEIKPLLAKSWTVSPDGLTYSFELVKANWQDGKPLTSEDVKYSLTEVAAKYSPVFAATGKGIASIETPAPDKLTIKLQMPSGRFLVSLSCQQGAAVLPSHLLKGSDPRTNAISTSAPVGTGAYKLAEWKHGDYLRFTKNTDYFEPGKPYLDTVVAKIITQAAARLQALQAGEVDVVQSIQVSDMAAVRGNPKLKLELSDFVPGTTFAFFNVSRKPLDDKRVRQALMMATDRDYIFKNAYFSVGGVATAPWTKQIKWTANPDVDYRKMYPFDIAKANALLDAAGVKRGADGKRFTTHVIIWSADYPEFQQVAVALKSMWQQVGVEVVIDTMERASLVKKVFEDRDFDISFQVYNSNSDPALGVARIFVSSSAGKSFGNASHYSNPKVDQLFEQAEAGSNLAERAKAYQEAQAILAEDLPVLTIRETANLDAATTRLKGLWGIQGSGTWSNAWLEK